MGRASSWRRANHWKTGACEVPVPVLSPSLANRSSAPAPRNALTTLRPIVRTVERCTFYWAKSCCAVYCPTGRSVTETPKFGGLVALSPRVRWPSLAQRISPPMCLQAGQFCTQARGNVPWKPRTVRANGSGDVSLQIGCPLPAVGPSLSNGTRLCPCP